MAAPGAIRAGRAFVELFADDSKLVRGLRRAQQRLGRFSASVRASGIRLLGFATAMAAPFVAGVKVFADFDRQMANVSTMLDEPEKHMEAFRAGIKRMSVEFGESTDTLAKGLYDILSASVAPEQALSVLEASARAAQAGLTDTGTAADAVTTILNANGLAADKAGAVFDLLFMIVKRGKTTFGELAPSIGNVASIAANAGVPLTEVGAALSTMTRNGVKTDVAITALSAMISSFLKPTSEAAKAARALGFEMSTATLKSEGLAGVFKRIAGLPPDAIAKLFPNVRALRGVMPALGNMEGFLDDVTRMGSSGGATMEAFDKIAASLAFNLGRAKQAVISIFRAIGSAVAGPIGRASDLIVEWAGNITRLIDEHQGLVVSVMKIVGVIGAVGAAMVIVGTAGSIMAFVFGGLASIVAGVGAVLGGLVTVLGALFSPLGLIIGGVIALGVNILKYTDMGGKALAWLGEKFGALRDIALKTWNGIRDALASGDIGLAARIFWLTLKVAWGEGIKPLKEKWLSFKRFFLDVATKAFYGVLELWETISAKLTGTWEKLKSDFKVAGIQMSSDRYKAQLKRRYERGEMSKFTYDDLLRAEEVGTARQIAEEGGNLKEKLADIASDRDRMLAAYAENEADALAANEAAYNEALESDQKALEDAKKAWRDAIAAASEATTPAEDKAAGGTKAIKDGTKVTVSAPAVKAITAAGAQGTFGGAALFGLAVGKSVFDRTASAAERTAENTEKLVTGQEEALSFAP